jgi:hypothetical protein
MRKLMVIVLMLLAVVGQVAVATAQAPPSISPPPPPTSAPPPVPPATGGLSSPNFGQPMPWWSRRTPSMPGMPWFYRAPTPPPTRQCRVVSWYLAQFWNTDEWGKTVTWVGYQPQYACN